jgi:hypothetical protein
MTRFINSDGGRVLPHITRRFVTVGVFLACLLGEPVTVKAAKVRQIDKLVADDAASRQNSGWEVALVASNALVGAPHLGGGAAYLFQDSGNGDWQQAVKFEPDDLVIADVFGFSVSVSETTALVGNVPDYYATGGVGSAYVFQEDASGNWMQVAKLRGEDSLAGDQFGHSVSLFGNEAIIGARSDDVGLGFGSAYLFKEDDDGNWSQTAKLTAGDATFGFGHSVSLFESTALIGSVFDDGSGSRTGAAYVFEEDSSGNWLLTAKLVPDDADAHDQFGYSVSLFGDLALVGARFDDDRGEDAGAAYLFARDMAGDWSQLAKFTGSHAESDDWFGSSVSISESTAVVGAHFADAYGNKSGIAYAFENAGDGQWRQVSSFVGDDIDLGDQFGIDVAVSNQTILVGANGVPIAGSATGAAYLFRVPEPATFISVMTAAVVIRGGLGRRRGQGK